jgi:CheY-like chemotaxis protein
MEINEGRYTPVIALTAGAFRDEKLRCTSAGMDDFLTKPIEPEKIKNVLMKYLKL